MAGESELLDAARDAISGLQLRGDTGVAFSGGVDSALLARVCSDMGVRVRLLTVGFAGSHDVSFAAQAAAALGLKHHTLEIDPDSFGGVAGMVSDRVQTGNLSWIENCIAFYYVAKLASSLGIKTVLTANGIDELFCGYDAYRREYGKGRERLHTMVTERLENERAMVKVVGGIASDFGVRILQPLLSDSFAKFAGMIPLRDKILGPDDIHRKHIVRRAARLAGVPEMSYAKRKKALQYGSLIHKRLLKSKRAA